MHFSPFLHRMTQHRAGDGQIEGSAIGLLQHLLEASGGGAGDRPLLSVGRLRAAAVAGGQRGRRGQASDGRKLSSGSDREEGDSRKRKRLPASGRRPMKAPRGMVEAMCGSGARRGMEASRGVK
jgi:hypothetical protein